MHTKKRQLNLLISTLALSGKGKKKKNLPFEVDIRDKNSGRFWV